MITNDLLEGMTKERHAQLRKFYSELVDCLLDGYNKNHDKHKIKTHEEKAFVLMTCCLSLTCGCIRELYPQEDWDAFLSGFLGLCRVNLDMAKVHPKPIPSEMVN